MDQLKFDKGCMWEGYPWKIRFEEKCNRFGGGDACEHCHSIKTDIHPAYTETSWVCPAVVVASNEGDYNSTGVCLDCILAAAEKLQKDTKGKYELRRTGS